MIVEIQAVVSIFEKLTKENCFDTYHHRLTHPNKIPSQYIIMFCDKGNLVVLLALFFVATSLVERTNAMGSVHRRLKGYKEVIKMKKKQQEEAFATIRVETIIEA